MNPKTQTSSNAAEKTAKKKKRKHKGGGGRRTAKEQLPRETALPIKMRKIKRDQQLKKQPKKESTQHHS